MNSRRVGRVKWFGGYNRFEGRENDFGFISPESDHDLYVHKDQIRCSLDAMRENVAVTFEIRTNPRNGRAQAVDVRLLTDETDLNMLEYCFCHQSSFFWRPVIQPYLRAITIKAGVDAVEKRIQTLVNNPKEIDYLITNLPTGIAPHFNMEEIMKEGASVSFFHLQKQMSAAPTNQFKDMTVVGVTFDNRQSVVAALKVNDIVWLRREPKNSHDRNAIRVETQQGQQVGYIDRMLAASLAPILDRHGQPIRASVTHVFGGHSAGLHYGVRISFDVPAPVANTLPSLEDLDL